MSESPGRRSPGNYVKLFELGKIRCSSRLLISYLHWCHVSYIFPLGRNLVLENLMKLCNICFLDTDAGNVIMQD